MKQNEANFTLCEAIYTGEVISPFHCNLFYCSINLFRKSTRQNLISKRKDLFCRHGVFKKHRSWSTLVEGDEQLDRLHGKSTWELKSVWPVLAKLRSSKNVLHNICQNFKPTFGNNFMWASEFFFFYSGKFLKNNWLFLVCMSNEASWIYSTVFYTAKYAILNEPLVYLVVIVKRVVDGASSHSFAKFCWTRWKGKVNLKLIAFHVLLNREMLLKPVYFFFGGICISQTSFNVGSGCDSVGRAFASDTRGTQFDSSHRQIFYIDDLLICQLYWKDKNKEKQAWNGPFL